MSKVADAPTLSIIIPAYNEAGVIKKCLDSLMPQLDNINEIIVVDNNSSDGTGLIAASYPDVTVIREARQGISYARSTGFDHAQGTIVARIDADSIASPDWATVLHNIFADTSVDAACGNMAISEFSPPKRLWIRWFFRGFRLWHQRSLGLGPVMYGTNCAMRRNVWRAIRGDLTQGSDSNSEDVDVTCSVIKRGFNIHFSPQLLVKGPVMRSLDLTKARRYYRGDNATLTKYQMGNQKRWNND